MSVIVTMVMHVIVVIIGPVAGFGHGTSLVATYLHCTLRLHRNRWRLTLHRTGRYSNGKAHAVGLSGFEPGDPLTPRYFGPSAVLGVV